MMSLLDALSSQAAPASLKQLAAQAELHPSTAHRILNVMVQHRMAERVEPGTYRLGMRLLELGAVVRSRTSFRQEAWPCMRQLHQQLGEAVNLAVRHDDEIIYVECTSPTGLNLRVMAAAGARALLHATSVGKVFLSADTPEKCLEYAIRTGLPRLTENTITDQANFLMEIENVRRQGHAMDNEEWEKGVSCVAAGIYNDEHQLVAALSISAPAERFNKAWAVPLRQTSDRVSKALGFRPVPAASPTPATNTHA